MRRNVQMQSMQQNSKIKWNCKHSNNKKTNRIERWINCMVQCRIWNSHRKTKQTNSQLTWNEIIYFSIQYISFRPVSMKLRLYFCTATKQNVIKWHYKFDGVPFLSWIFCGFKRNSSQHLDFLTAHAFRITPQK